MTDAADGTVTRGPTRSEHRPQDAAHPLVVVEDHDQGVRWLRLDRPAARNALSLEMLDALADALAGAATDTSVRVVVIAGNGPGFCAGHDLREVRAHRGDEDGGTAFFTDLMARCAEVMQAIVHHRVPVIAAVDGIATAAGAQLVASCDLAVATQRSGFATPGVNIGLFCSTPMVALSRNVHPKHAMEMLLTGELIAPERAAQIGLINRVVADDALDAEVAALAGTIAAKSATTLRIGKEAFARQRELPLEQAYAYTSQVMVANLLEPVADEGIGAFLDKRAPSWPDA
ncbi:MAG: enoyl-CoA hydratase [Nitriliruptoraceae bacterium]|nr:enoyl-CoA hydratase [Nitriliruptoraceae bacterium]